MMTDASFVRELTTKKPNLNQINLRSKIHDHLIEFVEAEIIDNAQKGFNSVDLNLYYFVDYDKLTAYLKSKGFEIKHEVFTYRISW